MQRDSRKRALEGEGAPSAAAGAPPAMPAAHRLPPAAAGHEAPGYVPLSSFELVNNFIAGTLDDLLVSGNAAAQVPRAHRNAVSETQSERDECNHRHPKPNSKPW